VLEIACGNGQLARWMAGRGVRVVATDVSERMIELARERTDLRGTAIDYRVLDATDPDALARLGPGAFDAVVCNMALMDMPSIDPLAEAVPALLPPGGRFVFSVTHPCFNVGDARKVASVSEEGGRFEETVGIEVRRYLTPRTVRGLAMIGQPEPHPYFERPLRLLLGTFLREGLLLDALEEPSYPAPDPPSAPWHAWSRFAEIPPALVVRLRPRPSRRGQMPYRAPVGRTRSHRGRREASGGSGIGVLGPMGG
jgi:SAM-dependent methyltransferase